MKKYLILIVVVAIVLMIVMFFGGMYYQDYKQQKDMEMFQQGYNQGSIDTITTIHQRVSSCQQVPLNLNNLTITLFAIECIPQ